MREIRLKALETYNKLEMPTWGPDLSELNMDEIATYVRPKSNITRAEAATIFFRLLSLLLFTQLYNFHIPFGVALI